MSCADCISEHSDLTQFIRTIYPDGYPSTLLPFSGSIELTLRCNMRCKHCYILYPGATDGEMTTDEVKKVLDELADNGVLFLLMTGGEILARSDFKEIYLYAKEKGFILSLFTNATMMTEEMADFLAEWPPRKIEITIYGHTAETYEAVSGIRGSHGRFRRGVRFLMERNLPVALKTMVMKTNRHEFEDIKAWAEELGVPFRYDAIMNTKLDGNQDPLKERLPAEEVVALEAAQDKERKAYQALQEFMSSTPKSEHLFTCGAGVKTFHVDPAGRLHPCMMWRADPFDLLNNSLKDGWKAHVNKLRLIEAPGAPCTSCEVKGTCGRCAALSLLEMGDPKKNIPYHCEVGSLRKALLNEKSADAAQTALI